MKKIYLLLLAIFCSIGMSWGWNTCYYADASTNWDEHKEDMNTGETGKGAILKFMSTNYRFRFNIDGRPVGESSIKKLTYDSDGVRLYRWNENTPEAAQYIGDNGYVYVNVDQYTGDNNYSPWVWLTRATMYIKHNWGGNTWEWQELTDNHDGTYTAYGLYGGTICNIRDEKNTANSGWGEKSMNIPTGIQVGTFCKFTLSGEDYSVTVTTDNQISLAAQSGDDYYATFSNAYPVQFAEGVTVYTVSVANDIMSLNEVTNRQVPANTGVLIKTTGTTATYNYIASASALENNMLYPASKDKAELTNHLFYKLAYASSNKDNLGFYWGAANGASFTSREGSAYLAIPVTSAPAHFTFEDEEQTATAIENATSNDQFVKFISNGQVYILHAGVVYDIMGRVIR